MKRNKAAKTEHFAIGGAQASRNLSISPLASDQGLAWRSLITVCAVDCAFGGHDRGVGGLRGDKGQSSPSVSKIKETGLGDLGCYHSTQAPHTQSDKPTLFIALSPQTACFVLFSGVFLFCYPYRRRVDASLTIPSFTTSS